MQNVTLTTENLLAFSPIIIVISAATIGMLGIAIKRHHFWNTTLMVMGINIALAVNIWVWQNLPTQQVTSLFIIDPFACFYIALILISTLACLTLAHAYMETHPGNKEELYLLMVLSASGGMILVTANHFAGLFVGMEILSIPLYGLAAYSFQRSQSLESGIKYLILSAIATAFLLFGMALLYADTGHLTYTGIQQVLATHSENSMLIWAGVAMMLVAFAFKLSLIPFHLWTPDVYEGAPVPITAFLATVSKIAAVAALLRLLHTIPALNTAGVQTIFAIMASVSIIGGNLLALMQSNLKRLLGFSSIAHFGYLFIAFVVNQQLQSSAIAVYLLAYTITTLAAFGVLTYISSPYQGKDIENITDYQGLFWQQPYLVTVLSIALLSLAGIPLTIGFIGKFYVMMLGVNAALWWLMATLAIGTVLGMYYYLRVLITMFRMEEITLINSNTVSFSYTASNIMLITTGILMLILGAYPQPMLQMALIAMGMN